MTERGAQFPDDDDDNFAMPESSEAGIGKRSSRSVGKHYVRDWLAQTPCQEPHEPDKLRCKSCKYTNGMMSAGSLARRLVMSKQQLNNVLQNRVNLGTDLAQRITDVVNPGREFSTILSPPPKPEPSVGSATDKFTARMRTQPPVRL